MKLRHRNPSPLRRSGSFGLVRQRGAGLVARLGVAADIGQDQRMRRKRLEVGAGETLGLTAARIGSAAG